MTKGRSNTEAYESYKNYVRGDRSDVGLAMRRTSRPIDPGLSNLVAEMLGRVSRPTDLGFLNRVAFVWKRRYSRRQQAIHHLAWDADFELADTVARDLLVARTRARNSLYTTLPDLSPEQIAFTKHTFSGGGSDVSTLLDIPSYGPSLLALWTEAKKQGLSDADAAAAICQWADNVPAAWNQEDERKIRQLPAVEPLVRARMTQIVAWRRTGDFQIPWEADVDGHGWQVRLNDFPDEPMYTLLIEGAVVGDFQEWPQAWDRGEPKPEVAKRKVAVAVRAAAKVDAATLLSRYRNGECEAVWRDLVALGADVRVKPYKKASEAVAQETMRRAGQNIGLLVGKLRQMDYQFLSGPEKAVHPCTPEDRKLLRTAEREDLHIPLALRAFLEEVGWVSLQGSHPTLCPVDDSPVGHQEPLVRTDPLELIIVWDLESILEGWQSSHPEDRTPVSWDISADAESKADMLTGAEPNGFYSVTLPNASADCVLEGEPHEITFVEYLRLCFRWGGFPGWEKIDQRPEKELAFLREGLIPF